MVSQKKSTTRRRQTLCVKWPRKRRHSSMRRKVKTRVSHYVSWRRRSSKKKRWREQRIKLQARNRKKTRKAAIRMIISRRAMSVDSTPLASKTTLLACIAQFSVRTRKIAGILMGKAVVTHLTKIRQTKTLSMTLNQSRALNSTNWKNSKCALAWSRKKYQV